MGDRTSLTRILCVNCNICVNKLRRYPVLRLDPRVTSIICSWTYPQIMTEGDYICEACKDLAMFAVNQNLQQETSSSREVQAGPSHKGHTHVCRLCGCSIARRQSDQILRDSPTDLQGSMIAIIESKIAPQQILESDRVCHPCWLRTQREARRMSISDEARSLPTVQEDNTEPSEVFSSEQSQNQEIDKIALPDYRRAANTNSHCVFPHCSNSTLRTISDSLRAIVLSYHHYYMPELTRVCDDHLNSYMWDTLYESENSINVFTTRQIQHVFSFVNAFNPTLDFKNIEEMDERVFIYWIGYTKEKFFTLLEEVPRILDIRNGKLGLAMLLLKLRTGDSDDRISMLINMPRRTLETLMDKVREVLLQDFVPSNLGIGNIQREQLLQRNLTIPGGLYSNGNNCIVICDGTYIYMHKSANYRFQKDSYSLHKYRNLLKPFMIVATDGYIIDCFGPYKATSSDAEIMKSLFRDGSSLRSYFSEDDVFILDRGFRDCISFLEECGYRAYMPDSLLEGEHQLTTEQANRSRCITMCRWVVEAVNGHFKRDFKLLRQDQVHWSLPHMMPHFQIAAALLNRFGVRFTDGEYANEILEIVQERRNLDNNLSNMVQETNMNRRTAQFQNICADRYNLLQFPRLEQSDLILFALGTYQIRQARSYYGEHVRFHGGYRIEVCSEPFDSEEYDLRGSGERTLIRGRIKSRHVSRKQYYVYILIENNVQGRTAIVEYCCSCLVGRRTLGCCAHVMTLVWYLGWARHEENITAPAGFLDEIIVRDDDDDDEDQ